MKYIPGLIPEKHRVLSDYFQSPPIVTKDDVLTIAISVTLGIATNIMGATFLFQHPLITLVLCSTGFILFPRYQKRIEKKFEFKMTLPIKFGTTLFSVIVSAILLIHYNKTAARIASVNKLVEEKARVEKEIAEKKAVLKKDSVQKLVKLSDELLREKKYESAVKLLDAALSLASTEERAMLKGKARSARTNQIINEVNKRNYSSSLLSIDLAISDYGKSGDLLYYRGLCLNKIGKTREAVQDLKTAIGLGNGNAKMLHEAINPLRKRQVGTLTRCCDGSSSSATGRGACSHHGGVCNWNEPIYETYRKY